jgi:hypothetical protein
MMPRNPVDLQATTKDVKAHVRRVIGDLEPIEQSKDRIFQDPRSIFWIWSCQSISCKPPSPNVAAHGGADRDGRERIAHKSGTALIGRTRHLLGMQKDVSRSAARCARYRPSARHGG